MIRNLTIAFVSGFVILTSSQAQKKVFTFSESRIDTISVPLKNILIVGIGMTASRLFLDKLAKVLVRKFDSEEISSEYRYLGFDDQIARQNFDTIQKEKFDAILFFLPVDTVRFGVVKDKIQIYAFPFKRQPGVPITTSVSYHQDFNLRLYSLKNNDNSIWNANLVVDFDLLGLSNYQAISNKIYWRLQAHKFIN